MASTYIEINAEIASDSMIVDTRANILALTPENGQSGYSTDTDQYYTYSMGEWKESSAVGVTRTSAYDIGYHQTSNLAGYGVDYITDKTLSNVTIGGNMDTDVGAIRVMYDQETERTLFQIYINGEYKTILTGINIVSDIEENTPDVEFTDFSPWTISLISGNSDVSDADGIPLVQNMKINMGAFSSPLTISGGSF